MPPRMAVVCEDGVLRHASVGNPDTFFSRPARVRIKKTKVFGFVTKNEYNIATFIASNDQKEARKVYRRSTRF